MKVYQLFLLIQLCAIFNANAQDFYFKGTRNKDALSFNLVKNLIIVPLYLNDKGPFNFILDTGVGPLIITDPSLIDSIQIKVARTIKISGLGEGNEVDAFVSNDISAKLGHAHIDNIPTAILKKDFLGLTSYVGTKIYGLLGYHFFNSFIVDLRYNTKRLLFRKPGAGGKIKGVRIPIEIINSKPYITVDIESPLHGKLNIKTLVDNGASHAISLERLNEQPFPVPESSIQANLGIGMGGHISGRIGRISQLNIGGFVLKNVLSSYPEYDDVAAKVFLKERNGNLGADILSRFNVVFDYEDRSMYLKKGNQFNRPFQHDMSGIDVYMQEGKTRHYFVGRIEPGSPAERADIQVDDEIVQINFQAASNYKLDDINHLFKSANGKVMILSIYRNKTLLVRTFELKQRI